MIRIDHVTFSYGEENENAGGVHDINLTVEDGQCVVLCGESGSGKTTITRLINGLIPHYYEGKMNGEVWVNGAKVSEQPLYDILLHRALAHSLKTRMGQGSIFFARNPARQI